MEFERGGIVAGRYRLERTLARGGMGAVWIARHLKLDVDVAIKFIAPELAASPAARARFEREAKASAQLRIPNVVQVHDYGVEDDCPYLVMELLEGEGLDVRLAREGRLGARATLDIINPLCKALRHAHDAGLVHRDIKPGNIFLARQGVDEVVKILDFGIAKATTGALAGQATAPGMLLGSPHYMSPEQVNRRGDIDPRSDLWSLGVVVFQCLTGALPFQGDELGEVLMAICTQEIPVASRITPDLEAAPEMDRFLARALMREPERRFQDAIEFAEALTIAVESKDKGEGEARPNRSDADLPASTPLEPTVRPPETPAGTLSASGKSVIIPSPKSSRHAWIALALSGSLIALGLAYSLLHGAAPAVAPTPPGDPAAASPPDATIPTTEAPAPPEPRAMEIPDASTSAQKPVPPPRPRPRRPLPVKPPESRHDPLDTP